MARRRGNRWQADVIIDGVRKRPSFRTQEDAENYERMIGEGINPSSKTTLGPFIDEQFERIWGDAKSKRSIRLNWGVIYRYLPRDTELASITDVKIDDVVTKMQQAGMANGTINRKLANISKALKRAKKLRLIAFVPDIERMREPKGRMGEVSAADEREIFLYLGHLGLEKTAALIKFLIYTGCRVGEAYRLERNDVDGKWVTFRETKNGDDRTIPLVAKALEAWKFMCRASNEHRPFSSIPRWTFRDHWNRIRAHFGRTEDPNFVPHILRHTCATRLVRSGVDLPRVQRWLGHKSIQVTMRYAHLAPKDLDVAAKALEGA